MEMFCNKCGTGNVDGSLFCSKCGNRLGLSVPSAPNFEKEGLLSSIIRAKKTVDQVSDVMDRVQDIEAETEYRWNMINLHKFWKMKDTIVGVLSVLLVIMIIGLIASFIPVLHVVSLLGWVLIVVLLIRKNRQINADNERMHNEINAMSAEKNGLYEKSRQILQTEEGRYAKGVVPQDYFYRDAVDKFIFYFRNGHADTMKEAVKEYDTYLHRCKLEYEAVRTREAAERTAREAQKAATYAEMAARYGEETARSVQVIKRHTSVMTFFSLYDHF